VRQESTGRITPLNWAEWEVDWTAIADLANRRTAGTPHGTTLKNTGTGKGSNTPVLVNPVAHDAAEIRFEKEGVVAEPNKLCQ
jgi:hypothetical protein